MSTGPNEPLEPIGEVPTLPPQAAADAAILALSTELRRYFLVDADGTVAQSAEVSEAELEALQGGELSREEIDRLKSMLIFEMFRRNVAPRTICTRLALAGNQYRRLLKRSLHDGFSEERLQEIRLAEKAHLDSIRERAYREYTEATTTQNRLAALAVELDVHSRIVKLFGAFKAVPIEVNQKRQVSVELRVISSRDQLTPPAGEPTLPIIDVPPQLSDETITAVAGQTITAAEASDGSGG